MDLRDYIRVLRKGWATILAFVILGIGAGVALTLATTKLYEATASMFVYIPGVSDTGSQSGLAQGSTYVQNQVQSLTTFATSDDVLTKTITSLEAKGQLKPGALTPSKLAGEISADAPLNKVLINLHVTDPYPVRARDIAAELAQQFKLAAQTANPSNAKQKPGPSNSTIAISIPHAPQVPGSPVKPNKVLNIGLGFVVGLLIGVGVVVLREVLDNTVKGPNDFTEANLAVLGLVPFDKRTPRSPIAFRTDPHSARSEAYRQIRTNLQFVDVDNPPRIIAVTSAIPGEGKTTTAINLAAALAEAGSRVCLIEADLRRPSMAKALGLVGDVGFTTAVIGKAPVESVLQNAGRNLAVLTSGPIPPNPSELLISQHAKNLILDLARNVDFTIIDTPPLLPVTDGAELATVADATLLVHRAGKTTRDQALRSVEALEKVGRRPVGVILNMITRGSGKYDYEYAYYYQSYRPDRGEGKGAHKLNGHDADSGTELLGADEDRDTESAVGPFGGAAGSPKSRN